MKTVKNLALAIVAMLTVSANAQETTTAATSYAPVKGDFSTEVQFNPFSNNFQTFRIDGLKARYFFTDKDAVRVNLGFSMDNNSRTDETINDSKFPDATNYTTTKTTTETNTKQMDLKIGIGYERHFMNSGRVDLYGGAEVGFMGSFFSGDESIETSTTTRTTIGTTGYTLTETSTSQKIEYSGMTPAASPAGTTPAFNNPFAAAANYNNYSIYASVFTGIDFYVYKGIYVGTELGLRFNTGNNMSNGTYTYSFNSNAKTTNNAGGTSTITTTTTSWDFDSETGIQQGKTVNVAGTTTTETQIQNAYNSHDVSASRTQLRVYIEPALRLGWRF